MRPVWIALCLQGLLPHVKFKLGSVWVYAGFLFSLGIRLLFLKRTLYKFKGFTLLYLV
jgi:hypothetical protein